MRKTASITLATERHQLSAFERIDGGDTAALTIQTARWSRGDDLEICNVTLAPAAAREFGEWLVAWAKEHGTP